MKICVIDDGSSQIKLKSVDGITTLKIPSCVVNRAIYNAEGVSHSAYRTAEQDYTVLPFDDAPERTDTSNYQLSPLNRVLAHEVLRKAGFGGQEVTLGVTLPVNQYFELGQGGKPNLARIEAKKAHIKAPIESRAGLHLAKIADVYVFPEALPAAVDVMCDLVDGKLVFKNEFSENKRVCCVDIGGHSIDIVLFESLSGNIIAHEAIETGVIKLVDELQSRLMTILGETRAIERSIAETAMVKREYAGHDLSGVIEQIAAPLAQKVQNALERLASKRSTDYFLVVGGGASLIRDKVAEYAGDKTIVPEQPDESIARGVGKMLAARIGKQAQSTKKSTTVEA